MCGIVHLLSLSIQNLARYEGSSKLTGVIYIHRISDDRFTRIAVRNLKMFHELCGDSSLKNAVLVTNMWGTVPRDVGEAREKELATRFFKPVLDMGTQLARHHNTAESAHDIIRCVMRNGPITLQIQRELVDEGKNIIDTAAGEVLNKELNEQIRRHQVELVAIQEGMMKALKVKDEETRQELEEEIRKLQEQVDKMRMDSEGMASDYSEEKKRREEATKQMQEQARQERERAEGVYRQQMVDLGRRLRTSAPTPEREVVEQRINQPQHQRDHRPRGGDGCLIM